MLKRSARVVAFTTTIFMSLFSLSLETHAMEEVSCSSDSKCMYALNIQDLSQDTLIEKSQDFIEKYWKDLSKTEIENNKKIYIDLVLEADPQAINEMIQAWKETLMIYNKLIKDLEAQNFQDKDYIQKLSKALKNAENDMNFLTKVRDNLDKISQTTYKYKNLFSDKIWSKLAKIDEAKLERISKLLDNLKYKYILNSKYNTTLAKIIALDELVKEQIILNWRDEIDNLFGSIE